MIITQGVQAPDPKILFVSPYGRWRISKKNFLTVSERYRTLFENSPFPSIVLRPDDYSLSTVNLIKTFTRHPNSADLEFTKENAGEFFAFCSTWIIRRARLTVTKFIEENFEGNELVGLIDSLLRKGINTHELELIAARSLRKIIPYLLNFDGIIVSRILSKAKVEDGDDDLILDLAVKLGYEKGAVNVLNCCDLSKCSFKNLQRIQNQPYVSETIGILIQKKQELVEARAKLHETTKKLEKYQDKSERYINAVQSLLTDKHGLPEYELLAASRDGDIKLDSTLTEKELLKVAADNNVPEALFETAQNLETIYREQEHQTSTSPRKNKYPPVSIEEIIMAYEDLVEHHNEKSDKLISNKIIQLTRLRNKEVLSPVLTKFVKESDRPIFLHTAYEVSLLDSRAIHLEKGEKCIKRATQMGDRESERAYYERLAKGKDKLRRRCVRYLARRAEECKPNPKDGEFEFDLGVCRLFGIGTRQNAQKAEEHFKEAASKGFNVANLIIAACSKAERKRSEYFGEFVSNGLEITPKTYFVFRACLGLYDNIVVRLPSMEKPLLDLVQYLVTDQFDPVATEFLFKRSPDFLYSLHLSSSAATIIQKEINELELELKSHPYIVAGGDIVEKQFAGDRKLELAKIPNTVSSIGSRAFERCRNLRAVSIDDGTVKIGPYAFNKCMELHALFLPGSIEHFGEACFRKCRHLARVALPENLTVIENRSFAFCEKLLEIELPKVEFTIGVDAFEGCKALEYIPLSRNVKSILDGAFQFCSSLKIVVIPKNIGEVSSRCFRYCSQLRAVLIEEGITAIKSDAFCGCQELGFISFPLRGLLSIGKDAFRDCPHLHQVTLPKCCVVEEGAFDDDCVIEYVDEAELENNHEGEEEEEEAEF